MLNSQKTEKVVTGCTIPVRKKGQKIRSLRGCMAIGKA